MRAADFAFASAGLVVLADGDGILCLMEQQDLDSSFFFYCTFVYPGERTFCWIFTAAGTTHYSLTYSHSYTHTYSLTLLTASSPSTRVSRSCLPALFEPRPETVRESSLRSSIGLAPSKPSPQQHREEQRKDGRQFISCARRSKEPTQRPFTSFSFVIKPPHTNWSKAEISFLESQLTHIN